MLSRFSEGLKKFDKNRVGYLTLRTIVRIIQKFLTKYIRIIELFILDYIQYERFKCRLDTV